MTLPRTIRGLGGPIKIKLIDEVNPENDRLGQAVMGSRTIYLQKGQPRAGMISSLAHELFHFAMWDAGQHHVFTEAQQEVFCNLVGSMVAAADLWDISE